MSAPPTAAAELLLAKAHDRSAVFGIVGMGYVGLPLAMELVRAGYRVLGVDVKASVVDHLNAGHSHIKDVPGESVARAVREKRFSAICRGSVRWRVVALSRCGMSPR